MMRFRTLGWEDPLEKEEATHFGILVWKIPGTGEPVGNYRTIALISHASKVMLKILQVRLQQYMNQDLSDVQAGFRKGGGARDQIADIWWITEKAGELKKKNLLLLHLLC